MPDDAKHDWFEDIARMIGLLEERNVKIRQNAHERLVRLAETICRWNRLINLVSRKDVPRLVSYHFCDSASLLPIVRPSREMYILDVGGSNGLPGLVLSSVSPYLRLTICDPRRKREAFLREACDQVGTGPKSEISRVDSKAFQNANRERFDLIVARAVTGLRLLLKRCMPLLRPGGHIVAYKGSRCMEEVNQAVGYHFAHSGSILAVIGSPLASECNPLRLFAVAGKIGR